MPTGAPKTVPQHSNPMNGGAVCKGHGHHRREVLVRCGAVRLQ